MSKSEAEGFGVPIERRGYYFRSFNGKLNFAPPVYHSDWFELASVHLENGFPGDDVGVVSRWLPPDARTVPLSPEVVEKIKAEIGIVPRWRKDVRAGMWVGEAVAGAAGLSVANANDRGVVRELIDRLIQARVLRIVEEKTRNRESKLFVIAS